MPRGAKNNSDVFAQYGRNLATSIVEARSQGSGTPGPAVPPATSVDAGQSESARLPVGILGAGMAGLYAALMLAERGIPFQILEAQDRVGGRCFTHHFEKGTEWDYFDIGAMRFPLPGEGKKGPHKRLQDLFDLLDIEKFDYIYKVEDAGIMYFNGVRSTIGDKTQTYKAAEIQVPDAYIQIGLDNLVNDFLNPLAEKLLKDMEEGGDAGWKDLKENYDKYSTRSYLQFGYKPKQEWVDQYNIAPLGLPTSVINWMETFDKSSGWYDRALTETVLEALAFGHVGPKPEWHCIKRGTSVLPDTLLAQLRIDVKDVPNMPGELIVPRAVVASIVPSDPTDTSSSLIVKAVVTSMVRSDPTNESSPLIAKTEDKEYTYSHVISTLPLPNFAAVDTTKLAISPMQRTAIRELQYGPSIKIGMRFRSPWWKDLGLVGGQSFTDLPLRTIVYPSYGPDQNSNTLIASYCWTNDADKLGNLIDNNVDGMLNDLVWRNLAEVHDVSYEFIKGQHLETKAWNWNHSAWSGGAFAFFGPGQYEYLYEALNGVAADGRLQWAGELMSVRHAWIVGALDSAWAAVSKYLFSIGQTEEEINDFYSVWGVNPEWVAGPDSDEEDEDEEEEEDGGHQRKDTPADAGIPARKNLLFQMAFAT